MTPTYSLNDLAKFLDWASSKGLLKQATAQSRKIAALRVLGALDPSEQEDLRGVDRDTAFHRFVNKDGNSFTPESLATYRSRFQIALEDFLRYREDPASFRFAASKSSSARSGSSGKPKASESTRGRSAAARNPATPAVAAQALPQTQHTDVVFPIPIRDGIVVRIHNLPSNLSKSEAQRIAAVVLALAASD